MIKEIEEIKKIKGSEDFNKSLDDSKKESKRVKDEMQKFAKSIYWQCFFFMLFALLVVNLMITSGAYLAVSSTKMFNIGSFVGFFIIVYLLLFSTYVATGYRSVPEKEEWTIEFFGSLMNVWEPGPHLLTLPFFMKVSGRVFMGTQMLSLYMDGQQRGKEKDALMEFEDASAGLIARLFYKIFSAHRAIYNVDDLRVSIKEKVDASLRAHYGNTKLDVALKERSDIRAQTIIEGLKRKRTADSEKKETVGGEIDEAKHFKIWGTEIESFAVVDIDLPDLIIKQRDSILTATKEKEASFIKIGTAKNVAEAQRIKDKRAGKGLGQEIKQIADEAKIDPAAATAYVRDLKFFEAIKQNKGVVLPGDNTGAILTAGIASVANLTSSAIKEPEVKKEDKP